MQGLLHLAPQRKMPQFATATFQSWARKHKVPGIDGSAPAAHANAKGDIILWADTFNNYFHPDTSRAALEVLQSAGFKVMVPQIHLCCGRPLYDFGMLDEAKEYLENVMTVLTSKLRRAFRIVVLEPSCASVFRDELRNLFPHDTRAAKLRSQTFLLSEFLERYAPEFAPQLSAKSAAPRTLPSQIDDGNWRGRIAAAENGSGSAIHRFRMLRNGGPVWI